MRQIHQMFFRLLKLLYRSISKTFHGLERYLFWLKSKLTARQFIYLACILVSISSALAVIVLKSFAHSVFKFAQWINSYLQLPYSNSILPIIGIVFTVFVVQQFLSGNIQKGTSQIMHALAKRGGILPKKQLYSQIITSSLTVGLGGSAGLESPITITGAAFGSNFAQNYKLNYKERCLLLACGVASGIAAAFNAPIAGVLFAIEVVLAEISISAFIPLMISAATGALVATIVLYEEILLTFEKGETFDFHWIPYYVVLGLLCGGISIYYARVFRKIEHFFEHRKIGVYKKALFGAFILGVLVLVFPSLFGEGYESIKTLAGNQPNLILKDTLFEAYSNNSVALLIFLSVVMLIKVMATGVTLGSGGNGGNFAPSLFIGSYLGFIWAKFCNLTGLSENLPVSNFTLVGMAGILSGLFHAPLTALFLIAEITGGYSLMIPLMIVSSISYAISKRYETFSFDIKDLADKGDVFTNNKDKNILTTLSILDCIETDIKYVFESENLIELVEIAKLTSQSVFPVLDLNKNVIGTIDLNKNRAIFLNAFNIKFTTTKSIMQPLTYFVRQNESMESVMNTFDKSNLDVLLVLKKNNCIGYLTKINVLTLYRAKLKEMIVE